MQNVSVLHAVTAEGLALLVDVFAEADISDDDMDHLLVDAHDALIAVEEDISNHLMSTSPDTYAALVNDTDSI